MAFSKRQGQKRLTISDWITLGRAIRTLRKSHGDWELVYQHYLRCVRLALLMNTLKFLLKLLAYLLLVLGVIGLFHQVVLWNDRVRKPVHRFVETIWLYAYRHERFSYDHASATA